MSSEARTIHSLLDCPYCAGERGHSSEVHWPCPEKNADGCASRFYATVATPNTCEECPCGGDCYELRLHHG